MNETQETTELTPIQRLKAGIWDIHEGVTAKADDKKSDEESVMKGNLPRFKYVNGVKQRYILQGEFEKHLAKHRHSEPYLNAVVTDEQFHVDKAAEDLRYFNVDPASVKPLPATTAMVDFFAATAERDPRLLLAIHYVIEGSNNGAIMIARSVKQSYNLEGTDGTLHLQPYGNQIRDKWKAWSEAFNSLEYTDELMQEMVVVGRDAFHHMNAIGREANAVPEGA